MLSETEKKYQLIIGRHCLMRSPHFLLGAVQEAASYGAKALMIYLGAPQNSFRRSLSELKIPEFHQALRENNIDINNVIVHAPYLLNLANTTNKKIFDFSVEFLKKEIARMAEIGLKTIVLHPGSALHSSSEEALSQITKGLNLVLSERPNVRIALETMCQRNGEVGGTFHQLQAIIRQVNQPEKIGVCWDTCHLYTAGYDIKNNLEGVMAEFVTIIAWDKLWVIHINDSVFALGEKKDRHENIGFGKIGWEALKRIIWHPQFNGLVKILETPREREVYREEIKMLSQED